MGRRVWLAAVLVLGVLVAASVVVEHQAHADEAAHEDTDHAPTNLAHGEHGEHGDHGEHGGHHEAPGELNWAQGLFGVSEEGPHGLWFRPPGTPAPLLALLLNTAIVLGVVYYFGRGPIQQGLMQRRAAILKGMEEAAKMKSEAEQRLREYEDRLEHLDEELERMKREMREQGNAERERILAEARARREAMENEARRMVELELKAAREELTERAVRDAVAAAQQVLEKELGASDHRRLLEHHVRDLGRVDLGGAA